MVDFVTWMNPLKLLIGLKWNLTEYLQSIVKL